MSSSSLDASTSGGGTASTPPVTSSSSSPTTPTSGTPSDAAARREARKARILGKGTDRLAKLTKQARGDEAELLYPSTPPPATAAGVAPSQARKAGGRGDEDDPEEIDISDQARMDQQMEGAMQAWQRQQQQSAAGQGQGGQPMPQDPFAQMMAALTGGGAGSGAPGSEAGMGGMPDLSQLFAAMQQQQQGQPGQASADGMPPLPPFMQQRTPAPTSWLSTRFFSLLHTVVFLALGYFAVSTALLGVPTAQQHMDVAMREVESRQRLNSWASLAYYRPNTVAGATATGAGGVQARHFDIDGARVGLEGPVVSCASPAGNLSSLSRHFD